jgi:DNA-binding beta-propeller fold protein YncE
MGFITRAVVLWVVVAALAPAAARASDAFVNWEDPHVHPLELTPDGTRLLAVNTADNRLMVFDVTSRGGPELVASIPVGLDPVSVRARNNHEAWVVNHISDSISIVDLQRGHVKATLQTDDEPADVVFAGRPERAFITCSQVNRVLVVDPARPDREPKRITLKGEDPRALAVSADGRFVYAAIFESGNGSTILGGGSLIPEAFPPNGVGDASGPHGGMNPPPNAGDAFVPALNPANPPPPAVGLIVKKDGRGRWMDDNQGDWTALVSGARASVTGRTPGWDLPDRDLAIIDTASLGVTYATRLMNLNMALAVHPSGSVTVVGTDATNEVRFEPNVNGRFLRVLMAVVDPRRPASRRVHDLNPHLDYRTPTVPQAVRDLSVGDPRGIAWDATGARAFVTGMGSNNVVLVGPGGARLGQVPVGEGPTGVVFDARRERVYVLNRFGASLSVLSAERPRELARVPFFDPSPAAIKAGRKHLYDTHKTSGLGHVACASCHVDARMDRLAWDLGDPSGTVKALDGQNLGMGLGMPPFEAWHPMKGPMTTQTLQDIIGKEPLHWRGDRASLEEFNPAFEGLQGDDTQLTPKEMAELRSFLATLTFPPNPFRGLDNSLPKDLPLPGHYTTGRFGPAGQPLPNGNAVNGMAIFRPPRLLAQGLFACNTCHTFPSGMATNMQWTGAMWMDLPRGEQGEFHHALVSTDGSTNVTLKVPQLRNLYEKVGMELTQQESLAGFGFIHDGSVDSLARFITEPTFFPANDQEVADLVALLLSFSGSELPKGTASEFFTPPGPDSQDSHAAVGQQVTLGGTGSTPAQLGRVLLFMSLAEQGRVGLVVKGRQQGRARGYTYAGKGVFQSDRATEKVNAYVLMARAHEGSELTWTVVPAGTQWRIGVDQDGDGRFDRDELDRGGRPDARLDGPALAAGAVETAL